MSVFKLDDALDLVDPAVQKMWIKRRPQAEEEHYKEIANVESGVTDYNLQDSSISDMRLAGRITENASVVSESPIQGYNQTYTQVEFGLMLPITKHMWKFGIKKRKLERVVDELKRVCIRKREKMVTDKLNQGTNTSYTVEDENGNYSATVSGGNSVALFSSSQTREDGGTNNNNVVYDGQNYNIAAGYNGLKALRRTAARVLSPKGNQMSIKPYRIFVREGSTAAFKFLEVKGAIKRGMKPETFSNDGSAVQDFQLIELPYLTSDTGYYAVDPNYINDEWGIQYKESQPIMLEGPRAVFKTSEIQYKTTLMFDVGHNDYRGWFGSDGSGS